MHETAKNTEEQINSEYRWPNRKGAEYGNRRAGPGAGEGVAGAPSHWHRRLVPVACGPQLRAPLLSPWLQPTLVHTHRCLDDLLKPSGTPHPVPAGVDDKWGGAADGLGPSPCLPVSLSRGGAALCAVRTLEHPQVLRGAARSRDSRSSSAPPASRASHSCRITRTPIPGSASGTPAPRHTVQLQQTR